MDDENVRFFDSPERDTQIAWDWDTWNAGGTDGTFYARIYHCGENAPDPWNETVFRTPDNDGWDFSVEGFDEPIFSLRNMPTGFTVYSDFTMQNDLPNNADDYQLTIVTEVLGHELDSLEFTPATAGEYVGIEANPAFDEELNLSGAGFEVWIDPAFPEMTLPIISTRIPLLGCVGLPPGVVDLVVSADVHAQFKSSEEGRLVQFNLAAGAEGLEMTSFELHPSLEVGIEGKGAIDLVLGAATATAAIDCTLTQSLNAEYNFATNSWDTLTAPGHLNIDGTASYDTLWGFGPSGERDLFSWDLQVWDFFDENGSEPAEEHPSTPGDQERDWSFWNADQQSAGGGSWEFSVDFRHPDEPTIEESLFYVADLDANGQVIGEPRSYDMTPDSGSWTSGRYGCIVAEWAPGSHEYGFVFRDSEGNSFFSQLYSDPFEVSASMYDGITWLREPGRQQANGSWSNDAANTSMAVLTMLNAGYHESDSIVADGIQYIRDQIRADGSVGHEANRYTYRTSIAILPLVATHNSDYHDEIAKMRDWLIGSQWDDACYYGSVDSDNWYYGGFGYGDSNRPDLSNTQWALMGLKAADRELGLDASIVYTNAIAYLEGRQNDDGGSGYEPNNMPQSIHSMTAASVWSYRLCDVPQTDPRVAGGIQWLADHYSVTNNDGWGHDAEYYYKVTFAKSLVMSHKTTLGGNDWFNDLASALMSEQQADGSWPYAGFGGQELSTTWAILALQTRTLPAGAHPILAMILQSHADVHVYDPQGRHLGIDYQTGMLEQEISGASFKYFVDLNGDGVYQDDEQRTPDDYLNIPTEWHQVLAMPALNAGSYRIEVVGTSNGPFELAVEGYSDGDVVARHVYSGDIAEGDRLATSVTVTSMEGALTLLHEDLAEMPVMEIVPSEIVAYADPGFSATGSFGVAEVGGEYVLHSVSAYCTDLVGPAGTISGDLVTFDLNNFDVDPAASQIMIVTIPVPADFAGMAMGTIVVESADGGAKSIALTIAPDKGITADNGVVYVPEKAGDVATLHFEWIFREARYDNEVWAFRVDDPAGTVNGVSPGDSAYARTVFERDDWWLVFSSGQGQGATRDLPISDDTHLAFFIVQDNTNDALQENNPGNTLGRRPIAFFSINAANPDHFDRFNHARIRNIVEGRYEFAWEDLLFQGDRDFDDVVFTVEAVTTTNLQGEAEFANADGPRVPLSMLLESQGVGDSLGVVDFMELGEIDPSAGDLSYQLATAHLGVLTIETRLGDNGTAGVTLHDADHNLLTTLVPVDTNQRVDWEVEAGQTYYLDVTGDSGDVDLVIANLVNADGTTVTVHGTDGDDTFQFDAAASRLVTVNGVQYAFEGDDARSVTFDGGDGADTAFLYDSTGDDTLVTDPDSTTLSGPGYSVVITGTETLHAYAKKGGNDTAHLSDSLGNDKFKGYPTYSLLRGGGVFRRAKFFDEVYAHSDAGGEDTAVLFDSPKDDQLDAGPDSTTFSGEAFFNQAQSFENVVVYAMAGGYDTAVLNDSSGDDIFRGLSHKSQLYGDGYDIVARGFGEVLAQATAGFDKARLVDSAGDDLFVGEAHQSRMTGPGLDITAAGFDKVNAFSENGGTDVAELHDTATDNRVEATYLDGQSWAKLSLSELDPRWFYEVLAFDQVTTHRTTGHDTKAIDEAVDFLLLDDGWAE